jgi:hypothetical protein
MKSSGSTTMVLHIQSFLNPNVKLRENLKKENLKICNQLFSSGQDRDIYIGTVYGLYPIASYFEIFV